MQAPTAPGGQPAQEPDERACPSCGAANGLIAAFCWQCYRPFGAAGGPVAGPAAPHRAAGYPGVPYPQQNGGLRGAVYPPSPLSSPFPLERPKRGFGTMAAVVVLTLAMVAGVFFFMNRGPGVELPQSFGGLSQIQNPQVDAALEMFRSQADAAGATADMGVYGSAGAPSVALVWVADASVPNADAAFSEFAGGFNDGLGTGTLDESQRTTETIDGVQYLCVPVLGTPTSNVCMWERDHIFWILFDLSGSSMNATQELAVAAYGAPAP